MLDYRIETFLHLCQLMNYRKTADALFITQPAVTQHIHYLEAIYGCKLFKYQKGRLSKTDAAIELEQYARAVQLKDFHLRKRLGSEVKELRVGATKTVGDYVLNEYISNYLSDENHALSFIVDNTAHLLQMLTENKLDFAVIEGFFDHSQFDSYLFRKEPFVGICPLDHPFARKEVAIEDLFGETIIHREAGSGTRAILEAKLHGYNETLDRFKRQICISTFPIIMDLVKRGVGISFVYEVLAKNNPDIATFTIKGEPIERAFSVVFLKHADLQEQISQFFSGGISDENWTCPGGIQR